MKINLLLLLALSLNLSVIAQVKIDIPHFIKLYNEGSYKKVFDEAYEMRNKKEYGKMVELDYFMAKALCANGNFTAANNAFKYILNEYPLGKKKMNFILDEYTACQRAEVAIVAGQPFALASFKMINQPTIPIARVAGKLGYVLDCKSDTDGYRFSPDFNREELQNRLFRVEEKEKAVNYYTNYLGKDYNVISSGRYVFITQKPYTLSSVSVKNVTDKLEKAYNFFHTFYGIRPPDKLITVYLLENKDKLGAAALKVHGLTLPKSNIGYSSLDDLSILANSDADNIGTIYHELFHLMIRTDVGDIPGWLDEGIASLYETSTWYGNLLKGNVQNWRTAVLKEFNKTGAQMPRLKSLINDNWHGFIMDENNNTPCDIALNYALAKHFAIYLQQKGLLQKMVTAFKNRKNVFIDTLQAEVNSISIVEDATGMPIDSLQNAFDSWYRFTYKFDISTRAGKVEQECWFAYNLLEGYKYSPYPGLVSSYEYQDLMKEYDSISKTLEDMEKNIGVTSKAQKATLFPDELVKRMNKFLAEANAFLRRNPLH